MAGNKNGTQFPHHGGPDRSDALVLVSMSLVAAAIVVGLHVQVGLGLALSGIVGLSLFLGLAGFQAWRRSLAERDSLSGEVQRLEAEVGRLRSPVAQARTDRIMARAPSQPNATEMMAGVAASPAAGAPGAWTFRPAEPRLGLPSDAAAAEESDPPLPPAPSSVREDDVEMLQRRIKEMLYQVTAAEQARDAGEPSEAGEGEDRPVAALGIEASLGALRAAAHSMRTPAQRGGRPASEPAAAPAIPAPPPVVTAVPAPPSIVDAAQAPAADEPVADPQLVAIKEAIAAGRVDVFLEPILGLGDQAAQHYEVSIKLRGAVCEDLGTGEGDVLPGRGLLPLFDTARIERSAIVAERLVSRGKTGSVFSHASGESLIQPSFTQDMHADFSGRPATARQLVLTFAQTDIRSFRAAEQRAVGHLSTLGFRFAISGLTDLDMNFEAMAKAGFAFVKLDASVMTEGLQHPGGHIPARDVCRFLAEHGFGLIVEGIDSEETLAKVFGFGVLLGQGTLFGGKRPVKADVVARPGQAAA